MGNKMILGVGGRAGNDAKRERAGISLPSFPFRAFPARFRFSHFSASTSLRSKQHERGLSGRKSKGPVVKWFKVYF